MMATVRHVTAWAGRTKFQTDGFLFVGVYISQDDFTHSGISTGYTYKNAYNLVFSYQCKHDD